MKVLCASSLEDLISECVNKPYYKGFICTVSEEEAHTLIKSFDIEAGRIGAAVRIRNGSRIVEFENDSEIVIKSLSESIRGHRANTVLYDERITEPITLGILRHIESVPSIRSRWTLSNIITSQEEYVPAYELNNWLDETLLWEKVNTNIKVQPEDEREFDSSPELDDFLNSFTINNK